MDRSKALETHRSCSVEQVQHWTSELWFPGTLRDGIGEQGLELHENGNFLTHLLQVSGGEVLNLGARGSARVGKHQ